MNQLSNWFFIAAICAACVPVIRLVLNFISAIREANRTLKEPPNEYKSSYEDFCDTFSGFHYKTPPLDPFNLESQS